MSHSTGGHIGSFGLGGGGHLTAGGHRTPTIQTRPRTAPPPLTSICRDLGPVSFPPFLGERVYMVPFTKGRPLPRALARWQDTVNAMLRQIDIPASRRLYLMIDQARVVAGTPHRRPGPHIDGNWVEDLTAERHATGRAMYPETLLLASDVAGCIGYTGTYLNRIGAGGDCSKVSLKGMRKVTMRAGRVYAGNVTMIHESIPIKASCERTLVRINVPRHVLA